MTETVKRVHLRQIVDGLSEGVILVEPDETISYANKAALGMHGVERLDELGADIGQYRATTSSDIGTTAWPARTTWFRSG
jgi:PAS domain-containing protein